MAGRTSFHKEVMWSLCSAPNGCDIPNMNNWNEIDLDYAKFERAQWTYYSQEPEEVQ